MMLVDDTGNSLLLVSVFVGDNDALACPHLSNGLSVLTVRSSSDVTLTKCDIGQHKGSTSLLITLLASEMDVMQLIIPACIQ